MDGDQGQGFGWNLTRSDQRQPLADWAAQNARDKDRVMEAAARQLAARSALTQDAALAVVRALFGFARAS